MEMIRNLNGILKVMGNFLGSFRSGIFWLNLYVRLYSVDVDERRLI